MDNAGAGCEPAAVFQRLVPYPPAYIEDGSARLCDTFPIHPAELKRTKQWHATVGAVHEVVTASPTKAHLVLRTATRVREDGSPIETVSAFHAFTRTDQGWKIHPLSAVVIPA